MVEVGAVGNRQAAVVAAWASDSAYAQFARFVLVGAVTTTVYAVVFVGTDRLGAITANLVGTIVSTALGSGLPGSVETVQVRHVPTWRRSRWSAPQP